MTSKIGQVKAMLSTLPAQNLDLPVAPKGNVFKRELDIDGCDKLNSLNHLPSARWEDKTNLSIVASPSFGKLSELAVKCLHLAIFYLVLYQNSWRWASYYSMISLMD